jgi:phosphatidylserine/phosphatidylglycerophosphate/cardiolipin synthase-like enzyme
MAMLEFYKTVHLPSEAILENIFVQNSEWNPTNIPNNTLVQSSKDEILFGKLINLIRQAQEMICLQSFLIQDTDMVKELLWAKERGVKVYVMSAAEVRLKHELHAEIEPDFIKEDYKKMLQDKFANQFIHRSAPDSHAKFIVIDGKTDAKGMLFTNNFTKKGFSVNPEIAVALSQDQAAELFKLFVYHFWEKASHEQTETDFIPVKPFGQFQFPMTSEVLVSANHHNTLKNNVLQAIQNAKKRICLSTFGFDAAYDIAKAIFDKQKEGVQVIIFACLKEKLLNNQFKKYLEAGAKIYCYPNTHAKFLMVDDQDAYLMTANFEQNDFETSFNIGLKLSAIQTECLKKIVEQWQSQMYQWFDKQVVANVKKYYKLSGNEFKSTEIKAEKVNRVVFRTESIYEFVKFFEQPRHFNEMYQQQELTLIAQVITPKSLEINSKDVEKKQHKGFTEIIEYTPMNQDSPFYKLRQPKAKWIVLAADFDVVSQTAELSKYDSSYRLAIKSEDALQTHHLPSPQQIRSRKRSR